MTARLRTISAHLQEQPGPPALGLAVGALGCSGKTIETEVGPYTA